MNPAEQANTAEQIKHLMETFKEMTTNHQHIINVINALLKLLDITEERSDRDIIINQLEALRSVPNLDQAEIKKIQENLNDIGAHIQDHKKSMDDAHHVMNHLDSLINELSVFKERLVKISFDEHQGFFWLDQKETNLAKLEQISGLMSKLDSEKARFVFKEDKPNKDLLKLANELKQLHQNKKFKMMLEHKHRGKALQNFYTLYLHILNLLDTLVKDIDVIKQERRDIQKFSKELENVELSVKLNHLVQQIIQGIDQVIASKDSIMEELDIVYKAMHQSFDSLQRDKHFLGTLHLPDAVRKHLGYNAPMRIDEPFYIEVNSHKSFYKPSYGTDSTGVFSVAESKPRLFEQHPTFDNDAVYDIDSNINPLVSEYFQNGDEMINDFNGYRVELLELVKRSPKLDPKIKAFLIIPAYLEEKVIKRTLEQYSGCARIDEIAIILFENMPSGKKRDFTLAQVQIFRKEFPDVKLYHVFKSFKNRMPIGYLRKYITEYALLLKVHSKHPGNCVFIGGDADLHDLKPSFFNGILSSFETNPKLDAVEMKMDTPKEYRIAFPNLWVMQRLFDFSWIYMRKKVNPHASIRMYGPASSIKASSYLMIKGFNPRTRLCEDLQLGWLLDEARRSAPKGPKYFEFLPQTIVTNPRRMLSSYLSKVSFLDMYEGFDEKESIREMGWEDLLDEDGKGILDVGNNYTSKQIRDAITKKEKGKADPIQITLAYGLQRFIDWWQFKVEKSKWMIPQQFQLMFSRIMRWVGIEYQLVFSHPNWNINILNIEPLKLNLIEWIKQDVNMDIQIKQISTKNYESKLSETRNIISSLPSIVQKILNATFGEQCLVTEFVELSGGALSNVYHLNVNQENIIIKLAKGRKKALINERESLTFIKEKLETQFKEYQIQIPRIYKGDTINDTNFLVESALQGYFLKAIKDRLSKNNLIQISEKLAVFLAHLHKLRGAGFGEILGFKPLKAPHSNWFEYLDTKCDKYLQRGLTNGKINTTQVDQIHAIFQKLKPILDTVPSCFLHNDIWDENIIVNNVSNENLFQGIIDFESCMLGDNEYEVALVEDLLSDWEISPEPFLEKYKEILGLSENYNVKKIFYQLHRYIITALRGKRDPTKMFAKLEEAKKLDIQSGTSQIVGDKIETQTIVETHVIKVADQSIEFKSNVPLAIDQFFPITTNPDLSLSMIQKEGKKECKFEPPFNNMEFYRRKVSSTLSRYFLAILAGHNSNKFDVMHGSGMVISKGSKKYGIILCGPAKSGKSTITNNLQNVEFIDDDMIFTNGKKMYRVGMLGSYSGGRDTKKTKRQYFADGHEKWEIDYVFLLDNTKEGGFIQEVDKTVSRKLTVLDNTVFPRFLKNLYNSLEPITFRKKVYQIGTNGNLDKTLEAINNLIQ